jgi:hypothetical protein
MTAKFLCIVLSYTFISCYILSYIVFVINVIAIVKYIELYSTIAKNDTFNVHKRSYKSKLIFITGLSKDSLIYVNMK